MLNLSMQLSICDGGFICGSIEWGYQLSGAIAVLLCGGSLRRGLRWPVLGGARLGGAAFFALSAVAFWLLRWVAVLGTVGVAYWEVISVISSTIRY